MPEDDKAVEHAERGRRHGEKVAGRQVGNIVAQKRPPSLRRRLAGAHHVLGDGSLGRHVAQQAEFRFNTRRAPSRVLARHASDRVADLQLDWRSFLANGLSIAIPNRDGNLVGGGVKGGQACGKTSPDGMTVEDGRIGVGDVLATLCGALGIDHHRRNMSDIGRPFRVAKGAPVASVLK